MKRRIKTATGLIDKSGRLLMAMDELNEFFATHSGARVIASFRIVPTGTSEVLRAYYYKSIVPEFRAAFWDIGERMTEEQTERKLRELSPIMWYESVNEESGEYSSSLRDIVELSDAELVEHIETLKQIAAEALSLYIEDPKNL